MASKDWSLEGIADHLRSVTRSEEPPRDAELLRSGIRAARSFAKNARRLDADLALQGTMAGFIELEKSRYALDRGASWEPGAPLRLLLAGYTGSRNTGADVRVEEMIRQFRHLFGDDHLDLSILTIDRAASGRYFRTVKQLEIPDFYPKFLFDTVHEMHGVIACEGSMFKSKFANALSTMMVGALGLAAATGKLSVGYGGEAGKMDESLEDLVRRYCQKSLIIARNRESQTVLGKLGVPARAGTDTAWTFEPAPAEVGADLLRRAGWDGVAPVVAVCPINAFWWPVKPNIARGMLHYLGETSEQHYRSVYFHADSDEIQQKQSRYVSALAEGLRAFRAKRRCFIVLVGMEKLDRSACEALRHELGGSAPVFVSDEHDMYELVSLIRHASAMVSSRYHAIVTSMPPSGPQHGLVPSLGVTMDERIRNLMVDRGTPELALEVDQPDLAARLEQGLYRLFDEAPVLREGIADTVAVNLDRMGAMGQALVAYVRDHHPAFPFAAGLGPEGSARAHLPPLAAPLRELLGRRAASKATAVQAAGDSP